QDREGARPHHPAVAAAAGGSGHRITRRAHARWRGGYWLAAESRGLRGARRSASRTTGGAGCNRYDVTARALPREGDVGNRRGRCVYVLETKTTQSRLVSCETLR